MLISVTPTEKDGLRVNLPSDCGFAANPFFSSEAHDLLLKSKVSSA